MEHTSPVRPAALRVVAILCACEAVALIAIAALSAVFATRIESTRMGSVGAALFFIVLAGVLVAAVRALWRGRSWGRGVVFTWQVLQLVVGLGVIGASALTIIGAVLAAAAVVVAVLLLTRPVIAVTTQPPRWLR